MSQSLPATHSQHSLQQEQPESSKALAPPPPLRADTDEFPALDDVLRKKRSNKLFAPLSGRRSRKDSRASSTKLSIASERVPTRDVDEEVADSGAQEIEVQQNDAIIQLDTPAPVSSKHDKTVFRWAKLYENQRGITLFGQTNYGSRSLLPKIDPTPFTHDLDGQAFENPDEAEAAMSTPATLRDYQLPDGNWRWVSKTWMVDMDGNGDTCADGWQYNWAFRKKGWRPHPGNLSAGGWVRRRHWLRLMMRPAVKDRKYLHPSSSPKFRTDSPLASGSSSPSAGRSRGNSSATGSRAPGSSSIIITDAKGTSIISALEPDDDDVSTSAYSALGHTWRGDAALDWDRCRRVLMHYNRDGKKLEVWSEWLGITHDAEEAHAPAIGEDYLTAKGKGKMEAGDYPTVKAIPKDSEDYLTVKAKGKEKEKHLPDTDDFVQSPLDINPSALSTDEFYTPRPIFAAPKEYVEVVVRDHLEEILNLFVFPSSRTQFRTMLAKAGFLDEETNDAASAMLPTTPSQPEFWTRRPHSPSSSSSEHTPSKSPSPSVSRHASRKKGKRPASGSSDIDQTKPTSRDHTRYEAASDGSLGSSAERTDEPGRKKLSAPDGSLHVAASE